MPALAICKLQMRCTEQTVCYLSEYLNFCTFLATCLKKARAGLSALILVLQCYGFLFIMVIKEVLKAAFLVSELKIPSYLQCLL